MPSFIQAPLLPCKTQHGQHGQRTKISANYLQPTAFSLDFTTLSRNGNFGAVFFGQYQDDKEEALTDVVVKVPVETELGRQLYDMERHSNSKLTRKLNPPRRFPDYLGELIIPSDTPVADGLGRLGLVWRSVNSTETLEDILSSGRIFDFATSLGTNASSSSPRRDFCGVLLRELALILQDIQSCGIVHR